MNHESKRPEIIKEVREHAKEVQGIDIVKLRQECSADPDIKKLCGVVRDHFLNFVEIGKSPENDDFVEKAHEANGKVIQSIDELLKCMKKKKFDLGWAGDSIPTPIKKHAYYARIGEAIALIDLGDEKDDSTNQPREDKHSSV